MGFRYIYIMYAYTLKYTIISVNLDLWGINKYNTIMLVKMEIWSIAKSDHRSLVLMRQKGHSKVVPVVIRTLESQSILIGIGRVPVPRPLTHDLMLSFLKQSGAVLKRVEITDHCDEIFYARLVISQRRGRSITLDARPSDAIALAVRVSCPIMMEKSIVKNVEIPAGLVTPDAEHLITPQEGVIPGGINQLELDLQRAVESENYEEAASIRDRIRKLK